MNKATMKTGLILAMSLVLCTMPVMAGDWNDTFDDDSNITSSTNIMLGGGDIKIGWVGWDSNPDLISGIDHYTSLSSHVIVFNITGDDKWDLIAGDHDGVFHGYYWNGSQWISDPSLVSGLGDIGSSSAPAIAFNLTGAGRWDMIAGHHNGGFYGFYWNGSQWISDSSLVAGIGTVSTYASPSIAFNIKGDRQWDLIVGDMYGFHGFYWNDTQWVSNPSLVTGLSESYARPAIAFNITGDGRWNLISGRSSKYLSGYCWNGSQWISDPELVSGIGAIGSYYSSPAIALNITGDGRWNLIASEYYNNFYGFVKLLRYKPSAELTSSEIQLPLMQEWDRFYVDDTLPDETNITYKILNASSGMIGSVVDGQDISSIIEPSIRLFAEFTTDNSSCTPVLHDWGVCWSTGQPDIVPVGLKNETVIYANDTTTIGAVITNLGASVPAFNVSLLANSNNVSKETAGSLNIGGSATVNLTWIPDHVGTYNLIVVVDADNAISESNESNNEFSKEVTVIKHPSCWNDSFDDGSKIASSTNIMLGGGDIEIEWVKWDSRPDLVSGMNHYTSLSSHVIVFNITGDARWDLIAGDHDGVFHGYYWNDSQWISDPSLVSGLGDIGSSSAPAIAFNLTGAGRWDMIAGHSSGGFYGFYWNGSQWISDSSLVSGLGTVSQYSSPSIAFNITGGGQWDLIVGDKYGFHGFCWNGTQWISDPSLVLGLSESYARPAIAFNITGDGRWNLISGRSSKYLSGYCWNGSQWISDPELVSGIGAIGSYYSSPAIALNITGDGRWNLIASEYYNNFYGFFRLLGYKSSASMTSSEIRIPMSHVWDRFCANDTLPDETNITYRILDESNNMIMTVVDGEDISSLVEPSVRLFAELTTNNHSCTPVLHDWGVCWSDGQPDLAPVALENAIGIYANRTNNISAVITNLGAGVTSFDVSLLADSNTVSKETAGSLNIGETTTVNFTWIPDHTGNYNLTVIVDADNTISESNESNNSLSKEVTVVKRLTCWSDTFDDGSNITSSTNIMLGGGDIEIEWVKWDSRPDLVSGMNHYTSLSSHVIVFNITGDARWDLIAGDHDGVFHGYYWNGSQWISDPSLVSGLGDIGSSSAPAIAFNLTGAGRWDMIAGHSSGGFYGFCWNGSQWISDSSLVSGLGTVSQYSSPSIAFNITGGGQWDLIVGDKYGFHGFCWNGTQWIGDPSLVLGLDEYYTRPAIAFNITGDGRWNLISGRSSAHLSGYSWNGSHWINNPELVSGIGAIGSYYSSPAIAFNITGDGRWNLIASEYYNNFYGFVKLLRYKSSAELTSSEIQLPLMQEWNRFYANDTLPNETNITYKILNASSGMIRGVVDGQDISSIIEPSIRLFAELTTDNRSYTPVLHDWGVCWSDGQMDLAPVAIENESMIYANDTTTVGAVITNLGASVPAFNVSLLANSNNVSKETVGSLNTGETITVNLPWIPDHAGTYNLTVMVDADDAISENNERNNTLAKTVDVNPDFTCLAVTIGAYSTEPYPPYYNIPNTVDVTIDSVGIEVEPFNITLYSNGEFIGKKTVTTGLEADNNTTVSFYHAWKPVCIMNVPGKQNCGFNCPAYNLSATVDVNNDVILNATIIPGVRYHHYASTGPLAQISHDKLHGGVLYTLGDSWYTASGGMGHVTWHYDITLPESANPILARLCIPVWEDFCSEEINFSITVTLPNGTSYSVPDNFSRYRDWENIVWDLTDFINESGVYTIDIDNHGGNRCAAGAGLLVVYEDESKPLIEYWVTEGADVFCVGGSCGWYGITSDQSIATAAFPGQIDGTIARALLGTANAWGNSNSGGTELYFNDISLGTGHYCAGSGQGSCTRSMGVVQMDSNSNTQHAISLTDVTDYLNDSDNHFALQSRGDASQLLVNVFFVVEYGPPTPSAPFMIYGWVNDSDGTPVDNPDVTVDNMDIEAVDGSNYYQTLTDSENVNEGDVLRFSCGATSFEHVVSEEEMNAGVLVQNITYTGPVPDFWRSYPEIVSGLEEPGWYSKPVVFEMDETWYLISGNDTGMSNGYRWNGSCWQPYNGITSGIVDIGDDSAPAVFHNDGTWYLISGEFDGEFNGYNWTGSEWQSDPGIISGLSDIGNNSAPVVFNKDETWYMIAGEKYGAIQGYNWTGSGWISDDSIISGLENVSSYMQVALMVFYQNETWYLIFGEYYGEFYGFNWTGSAWQSDAAIISGLADAGMRSSPAVFEKDGMLHLISGSKLGDFYGYKHPAEGPEPIEITSHAPETPVSDTEGAVRTFNITVSQTVNVSWLIDGTPVQFNDAVTEASYMNGSAVVGCWNVSAVAENANGTDMQTWWWNVTQAGICGDVNDDGDVDMTDVMTLWYDIADYPYVDAYTVSNAWAADVNCDGELDMTDVMTLWYDIADYPYVGAYEVNCCG